MKRIIITLFLLMVVASSVWADSQEKTHTILFFSTPGCHRCERLKASLDVVIPKFFQSKVDVEHIDVSDIDNYKRYMSLVGEGTADAGTTFPALYLNGRFIAANPDINVLKEEITKAIAGQAPAQGAKPKEIDLASYFKRAGPLVIMSAGFVDGINPCAFTVIIFFMSFLTAQGYTRKKIMMSGIAFICASFVTYVLIGAGFFGGLHSLKMFKHISSIINISIGALSIVFGALSLYDGIKFARTGSLDMLTLQLPRYVKTRIHSIIGTKYRKSSKEGDSHETRLHGVIATALITGFLVSLFESACTGQVYLPTIVLILKTSGNAFMAFFYLIVYNLMFIIPLVAIFLIGLAGVSAEIFSNFTRRHMVKIKFIMAAVFFALGILLIVSYLPHISVAQAAEASEAAAESGPYFKDFGEVKEGDILKHTFTVENKADKTLTIKSVNTSCACTTYKLSGWTIEPGKSITVDVDFNTKGYPGVKHRYVYMNTDDPKNSVIMLEVKADIR